jgi:hypothetical protein
MYDNSKYLLLCKNASEIVARCCVHLSLTSQNRLSYDVCTAHSAVRRT